MTLRTCVAAALAAAIPLSVQAQTQSVRMGFGGTVGLDHPEVYVQNVAGFWKEERLNVAVTGQQGSVQSMQLLQAGQLDFAQITPETAITARAQGVPVVSVFATNKWISKLCVPPESPVQKVADLKGRKVGVPSATSGQRFFAQAMVKRVGVSPADVEYLPTGFGAAAAEAMKQGKVDALAYWGGWYIQVENMGYKFRCYELPGMENAPGHALFTMEDTLKKNPDLVERVGRAHAKGLVYAMSHPEATAKAYWTVYPETKPANVPEGQALASNARLVARILQDFQWSYPDWKFGMNSPQGWSALVQYLVDTGQLAQAVPAERMYSNALVEQYNKFDAAKVRSLP